jgi:glutamate carboxypeptidase
MRDLLRHLDVLSHREAKTHHDIAAWCGYRTGSYDVEALNGLATRLAVDFSELEADHERVGLQPQGRAFGPTLVWRKRPRAAHQVLLAIHTDVVYAEHEKTAADLVVRRDGDWLHAPGAADAKGGIAVLREALVAFELSPFAQNLGWRIVLNPDEEIGSPGSSDLLRREAQGCFAGLLFEPSLPDGSLVGERKGSGNFTLTLRGRAAHAGRNPEAGRNAIHAMAEVVTALTVMQDAPNGLTVNVGHIAGGGSVNRVPDLAMAQVNVRVRDRAQQEKVAETLRAIVESFAGREGYQLEVSGGFTAPPKLCLGGTAQLLQCAQHCGQVLGLNLAVKPSGGVCDGNRLAAAGLPNVDTLGPTGDGLHGAGERLFLPSILQRARLTALILMRLAQNPTGFGLGLANEIKDTESKT